MRFTSSRGPFWIVAVVLAFGGCAARMAQPELPKLKLSPPATLCNDPALMEKVTQINSYAKQISSLNQNIIVAQSANGQPPNDMLDQRDQLVTLLNQDIKATVVKQGDGSFSVFVGNGQPLVVGAQASRLP